VSGLSWKTQMEKLLEEHNFMRETFGQPTEQELGDFKMKRQIEQQSLRALNSQLEAEVRALEEERRKLRSELRYRAKWHGEAAAKLGLTNNQVRSAYISHPAPSNTILTQSHADAGHSPHSVLRSS
jgi:hypothetical protein